MRNRTELIPLIRKCGVGQDNIVMTDDPGVSFCKVCDRCVVAVATMEEFSVAKSQGDCVDIRIPGQTSERGSSIVKPRERSSSVDDIIPLDPIIFVGNPLGDDESPWGQEESR